MSKKGMYCIRARLLSKVHLLVKVAIDRGSADTELVGYLLDLDDVVT